MLDLEKKYNGKLLLFGEYLVLVGAEAFALPLGAFSGQLITNKKTKASLPFALYDYLIDQKFARATIKKSILSDVLACGLVFDSTIRSGYGNGSSGALSAALYDQFFDKSLPSLQDDRDNLIVIESYFQGQSSGIDPLVCYYNKPVYIDGNGVIDVNISYSQDQMKEWYLLDSNLPRNTGVLVEMFKNKLRDPKYHDAIQQLKETSNEAIQIFLKGENLDNAVHVISKMQCNLFSEMITDEVQAYWEDGLRSKNYSIKLCGAGGGGYYLVHVPDDQIVKEQIPDLWRRLIPMVDVSL